MSTSNPLEDLAKEARNQFILAKADGKLDAGEVVQIAVAVSQKIQRLAGLSGQEKRAVVLLTLKRGLESAGGVGGLPGLEGASPETKEALERQLLGAAAAALDAVVAAAQGKLDLRKPSSWKACLLPLCSAAAAAAVAAVPKDQPFLRDAVALAASVGAAAVGAPAAESSSPESGAAAPAEAPKPAEADTTPATESGKEPSPVASPPEAPAPEVGPVEVKFE